MAKLDGINDISAQKNNIAIDIYKTLHRAKSYPLDSTEIFTTYDTAVKYAKGEATGNKYQTAIASYPGQHITVVDIDNNTATMYQIQDTAGNLKQLATTTDISCLSDLYANLSILKAVEDDSGAVVLSRSDDEYTYISCQEFDAYDLHAHKITPATDAEGDPIGISADIENIKSKEIHITECISSGVENLYNVDIYNDMQLSNNTIENKVLRSSKLIGPPQEPSVTVLSSFKYDFPSKSGTILIESKDEEDLDNYTLGEYLQKLTEKVGGTIKQNPEPES